MQPSIFLDFNLPNAATWLYFSLFLTVALFFQFARVFSVRNLDLLTLFLLAPGLLLLQEAHALHTAGEPRGQRQLALAYVWLMAGSGYWFVRALLDLTLVRRPVASPNLNTPGLAWFGLALLVCLGTVATRRSAEPILPGQVGTRPVAIERLPNRAAELAAHTQGEDDGGPAAADVRFWVERSLAMACHLAVVVGLVMIGARQFQDLTAGVALGTLYLLVPYTAFHIAQFHIVWPAAFITWAVYCYRRPVVSGWLLGLAAGSAFVPVALFPLWVGFYARRGASRFALSFAVALILSLGAVAAVMWAEGWLPSGLTVAGLSEWLPWKRPTAESVWTDVHWAYRLPIFVAYVAFVAAITIWPSPKNLSHLVALSAAVLIGVQFWHADRGGVYVLWYLPLVLLMVIRPNLTGHEPPSVEPGGGVFRWAGAAWRRVRPACGVSTSNELAV